MSSRSTLETGTEAPTPAFTDSRLQPFPQELQSPTPTVRHWAVRSRLTRRAFMPSVTPTAEQDRIGLGLPLTQPNSRQASTASPLLTAFALPSYTPQPMSLP